MRQNRNRQIFTGLLATVFILLNIAGHRAVEKYPLKLDMTENSLYEFSGTTLQEAAALTVPVKITVFSREEDYVVMLKEVLKRFSALSPLISLTYEDPWENPVLVDYYASRGVQIQPDDIVIEGQNRSRSFSIEDMYKFNSGKTEITGLNAEQQLTSSLKYVNNSHIPLAAFTDGHNERPGEALISLFRDNNYEITQSSLGTVLKQNPEILVIAAPSRDFLPEEAALLNQFMNKGGRCLIFLEPSSHTMPLLEEFTEKWGIRAGEELVFEEKAFTGGNPVNIIPMYAPHAINTYFLDTRLFLTMPSSRSLYPVERPGSAYDVRSVLNSTPRSYGKRGHSFSQTGKTKEDIEGPFSLVVSSESKRGEETARLVVAGSRNMYGGDMLSFSSYANAEFLIQVINWLGKETESVHIPSRNINQAPLNIRSSTAAALGFLITLIIPFMFLLAGIIVHIRRKRL